MTSAKPALPLLAGARSLTEPRGLLSGVAIESRRAVRDSLLERCVREALQDRTFMPELQRRLLRAQATASPSARVQAKIRSELLATTVPMIESAWKEEVARGTRKALPADLRKRALRKAVELMLDDELSGLVDKADLVGTRDVSKRIENAFYRSSNSQRRPKKSSK